MSQQPENYTPTYINNPTRAQSFAMGQPVYVVKAKSTVLSYVLWFFLGTFGIHKFYLRQPIMGIFYIVGNLIAGGITAAVPFIGWIFYIPLVIVMIWDLFTIPVRVGYLNALANRRIY